MSTFSLSSLYGNVTRLFYSVPSSELSPFYRAANRALEGIKDHESFWRSFSLRLERGSLYLNSEPENVSVIDSMYQSVKFSRLYQFVFKGSGDQDHRIRSSKQVMQGSFHPESYKAMQITRGALSREQREQNKLVWATFKQALITEAGEERYKWICQRYVKELPIAKLESGDPFLMKYLKIFHTGLSLLTLEDVMAPVDSQQGYSLNSMQGSNVREIWDVYQRVCGSANAPLATQQLQVSRGSPLAQDQDKALHALWHHAKSAKPVPPSSCQKIKKHKALFRSRFTPWLEHFCKRTVNRELLKGQLIPVAFAKGQEEWYVVHAKIAAHGLVAYALKPIGSNSQLKPLLVFRPTQTHVHAEDLFETLSNDVDSCIGKAGWLAAKQSFADLMKDEDFAPNQQKIWTAGYSLGGAHLQYFITEHFDRIEEAYSFNAPGVDEATIQAFAEKAKVNSLFKSPKPFELHIFRAIQDIVFHFGEGHVGYDTQGISTNLFKAEFSARKGGFWHAHRALMLSNLKCQVQEGDINELFSFGLDGQVQSLHKKYWYSRAHLKFGWLLARLVYIVTLFFHQLEKWTGLRFFRKSLAYSWETA